jgi:hypothetical protein
VVGPLGTVTRTGGPVCLVAVRGWPPQELRRIAVETRTTSHPVLLLASAVVLIAPPLLHTLVGAVRLTLGGHANVAAVGELPVDLGIGG